MRSVIKYILFCGFFFLALDPCSAKILRGVSAKVTKAKNGVAKREADPKAKAEAKIDQEFFPDWVPFNKNIEELGELVPVKAKPKKRLAPPVSYVLKSLNSDPDDRDAGDIYGGDRNDNIEKNEWSDLNREANVEEKDENKQEDDLIGLPEETKDDSVDNTNDEEVVEEESTTEDHKFTELINNSEPKKREEQTTKQPGSEEDEYMDATTESKQAEEEAAKKAEEEEKNKVLSEVDLLKEQHAREREVYGLKRNREEKSRIEEIAKLDFENSNKKTKQEQIDYDEYDDDVVKIRDKYPINTSPRSTTSTTSRTVKTTERNYNPEKVYIVRDPEFQYPRVGAKSYTEEHVVPITFRPITAEVEPVTTTQAPEMEENIRISLVPEGGDVSNGPTSFFIKKQKFKKRRKPKAKTTPAPDASVAETVAEKAATEAHNLPIRSDSVVASSEHKKEGGGDYDHEQGGDKETHSEQHSQHEEHGKKAYEGVHDNTKTSKGHHDKEDHTGLYDDHGGHEKSHHKEDGHYGSHHQEEKGKKHAEYEESGKHSKGHNTKGSHNVHKKDEYEKKVEFFEEEGDSGEEEKHGGYKNEKDHSSGGLFKESNYKAGHQKHGKGESGHYEKGGHLGHHKGHKAAAGHDAHGKHGHHHHDHEKEEAGKKWVYHHGYPAKNSNLVVIDRRMDRYLNGPLYQGL